MCLLQSSSLPKDCSLETFLQYFCKKRKRHGFFRKLLMSAIYWELPKLLSGNFKALSNEIQDSFCRMASWHRKGNSWEPRQNLLGSPEKSCLGPLHRDLDRVRIFHFQEKRFKTSPQESKALEHLFKRSRV